MPDKSCYPARGWVVERTIGWLAKEARSPISPVQELRWEGLLALLKSLD